MPLDRPHFLCIGAQKAATSWLAYNLRQHPEVWMPPVKELHYFDRLPGQLTSDPAQTAGQTSGVRLASFLFPRGTRASVRAWHVLKLTRKHPVWASRFLFGRWTDDWYGSLFPDRPGVVTGEATPGYARLDAAGVAHVARCLPDVRLIYLLRDPVERAWSGARMHARKHQGIELGEATPDDQVAYLSDRFELRFRRHSDYAVTLDRWERHYAPDQLHVAFFEDVEANPAGVLQSVYRFLGVSDDLAHVPDNARRPVNRRAPRAEMSDEAGRWLTEQFADTLEATHARFQNAHTAGWLAAAARRLDA